MLCSLSKSGPTNWLDRLRSNKGLSTQPQNLTLDYYLSNPDFTHPTNTLSATDSTHSQDEPISSILSHLFIMDHNAPKPKKLPRKQPNPKFHSYSSNLTASFSNNNSDNNSNNLRENEEEEQEDDDHDDDDEDEEEEMKGYSRSEVAVIDTSSKVWKVEKMVYRKKNVWRVREKKGRGGDLKKRKRKWNENGNKSLDDRKEEISPDSSGALSQVPQNRLKFFRSPRKLEKSGSSSVLIRAISTGKKLVKTPPKNHLKDV